MSEKKHLNLLLKFLLKSNKQSNCYYDRKQTKHYGAGLIRALKMGLFELLIADVIGLKLEEEINESL